MEPITHALSGVVIRNFGFRKKAALAVLVISSVAPDLDFVTRLWGSDVMLRYHRGITHGVLAFLVVPVVMGLVFRKRGGFVYCWFLASLGYGLHIALDLTNPYGTRLFAPLDWYPYSADLAFIVDPYIVMGLVLSLLMAKLSAERARTIALATMAMMVFYMGVKHYFHERTEEFLRASLDEYMIERVVPMPNDFVRWWFIARNDEEIKTGFADLFTRTVYVQKTYPKNGYDPDVERSKRHRVVKNFLYFAQYPYAEVRTEGRKRVVKWRELIYAYAPEERFTATVSMDERGELISSRIDF